MKKYLFFALATVGLLASCNKNKVEVGNPYDQILDQGITTPELIQLGAITTDVNVETKGSGMIEEWAAGGSKIKVIGVVDDVDGNAVAVEGLDHTELTAYADGTVTGLDNVYYESGQLYKFYGYYLDDAIVKETSSGITDVTIEIKGTQDIMAAVTDPKKDFEAALTKWQQKDPQNAQATNIRGLEEGNLAIYAYSDKTARRGMVPNLTFHHLLSAMKFHFVHGQGESGISITGLSLKACVEGTVTVVAEKAAQVATASRATDALTEADVMTFDLASPVEIAESGATEAGSAMIFPGANEVVLSLTYKKGEGENDAQTTSVTVKAPEGGLFLPNTQYKVTISVYGKQAVVLNTSIEKWGPEEDIIIDDDYIQQS